MAEVGREHARRSVWVLMHQLNNPADEVRQKGKVDWWWWQTARVAKCASVPHCSRYILLLGDGEVVRNMLELVEWRWQDNTPLLEVYDVLFPLSRCNAIVAAREIHKEILREWLREEFEGSLGEGPDLGIHLGCPLQSIQLEGVRTRDVLQFHGGGVNAVRMELAIVVGVQTQLAEELPRGHVVPY